VDKAGYLSLSVHMLNIRISYCIVPYAHDWIKCTTAYWNCSKQWCHSATKSNTM